MKDKLNLGHRQRMRNKIINGGLKDMYDYEIIEMVLYMCNARTDQRSQAKIVLSEFKTISGILAATPDRLKQVDGLGDAFVSTIKVLYEMFCRANREDIANKSLLDNPEKVFKYCKLRMAYALQEEFRILFLNKKNFLILDEAQQVGTIDQTSIYPREVVRRVIELGAFSIIMVHNHPSGDPSPSKADILITKKVMQALEAIDSHVHDHIIIGKDKFFSIRANGIMDEIKNFEM